MTHDEKEIELRELDRELDRIARQYRAGNLNNTQLLSAHRTIAAQKDEVRRA